MKKMLTSAALMLTAVSFAQNNFNQYSLEAGYGVNFGGPPQLSGFNHFDVGFRYMQTEYWGAKLDYGYDMYKSDDGRDANTTLNRVSLQVVYNVGRALRINDIATRTFNILLHTGGGTTILKTEEGFTDKTGNFIIGGTAQFYISPSIALTGDLSGILNFNQNYKFDGTGRFDHFTGKSITMSAGITYYFGRNKSNPDWR